MNRELSSDATLYQALVTRDDRYEGRVWVGVTSTKIFCRLTCPARKPKRENSLFFTSVEACLESGFRPCKRCRPLHSLAEQDPLVEKLLKQLQEHPARRWSETDVSALGLDPSTVRRAFKRHFGITFLEMARLSRLRLGAAELAQGASVIEAQLGAGFESANGFRAALSRVLGCSPSVLKNRAGLLADWIDTPLGAMIAVSDEHALYLLEFFDRKALPNELKRLQSRKGRIGVGRYKPTEQIGTELEHYFQGQNSDFKTPTAQLGSEFTRSVWSQLQQIPVGETRSYGDIARSLSKPSASRAVARANGANQIAIVVPCHRVIGADGSLTGYGGGRWRKNGSSIMNDVLPIRIKDCEFAL